MPAPFLAERVPLWPVVTQECAAYLSTPGKHGMPHARAGDAARLTRLLLMRLQPVDDVPASL